MNLLKITGAFLTEMKKIKALSTLMGEQKFKGQTLLRDDRDFKECGLPKME
jgi:hypothetical protein